MGFFNFLVCRKFLSQLVSQSVYLFVCLCFSLSFLYFSPFASFLSLSLSLHFFLLVSMSAPLSPRTCPRSPYIMCFWLMSGFGSGLLIIMFQSVDVKSPRPTVISFHNRHWIGLFVKNERKEIWRLLQLAFNLSETLFDNLRYYRVVPSEIASNFL